MKSAHLLIGLLFVLVCWTCHTENTVVLPRPPLRLPPGTSPVPETSKLIMEGVYTVTEENAQFVTEAVVKWAGNYVSIFRESSYMVLKTGHKDSILLMVGHWRVPTSDATGFMDLSVAKDEGAACILKGVPTSSITIRGKYGSQNSPPTFNMALQYKRPFSTTVKSDTFLIVGHRGGGRTSDRLPVSENSIAMIRYAERLGANGVEIDIRLTKDKVPVLYHDPDINIRLTVKGPLNGPIENFTWNQLQLFVKLIRGEQIPRLDDVLTYVVDSTRLRFVWLDTKGPELVAIMEPIQRAALVRAVEKGRDLKILIGVPEPDVLAALKALPDHKSIPSLCEISADETTGLNSHAWGPRWTLGMQNDLVDRMHREGRSVLCWTLDVPEYIRLFIQGGRFDGLLTNYPSYIAYHHYIQE